MKDRLWLLQIPVIAIFAGSFAITNWAERGELDDLFIRKNIYPALQTINGAFSNLKFALRGPQEPKNKIAIIGIDEESLEAYGRWPWHRDIVAYLIHKSFESGAKVVGLDMVFAEPDQRIPDELQKIMAERGMGALIPEFETDATLTQVIAQYRDRLVLGWATDNACQPAYHSFEECPVSDSNWIQMHPAGYDKFSFERANLATLKAQETPLMSLVTFIPNLPDFSAVGRHAGFFNVWPDADGYIRRTPLMIFANQKPYPTLALAMAKAGMDENLQIDLAKNGKVERLAFANSGQEIPVSPLGTIEINFRGPAYTFPYVSAMEVMNDEDTIHVGYNREIASTKESVLKDAYVLIGATALGIYDMRAFPYDSNTPGVEGHATILDNILANDPMSSASSSGGTIWLFLLMILGGLLFAYFAERLESVPGLLLFLFVMGLFGAIDVRLLFENDLNWNMSLMALEYFTIFLLTLAVKYVMEEKQKKFIKGAMGRYISPAMVNEIVKDPDKLKLGGEKRELTILFSDIRSFTTMSEKMDAKQLAAFLNDYLGDMTDIIVEDYKGTLDKYIGDAVMAFWGAPILQKDHALNACLASIKMMEELRKKSGFFKKEYGINVDIGIGVNTGAVSVGNMGSEKNFNYTVLGDHVNLASRLEGLTKYYSSSIITSRFTLDSIEESKLEIPGHRTLDLVKVKGKKKAVELVQIFDQAVPKEAVDYFNEGRRAYSEQKWDEALDLFKKADQAYFKAFQKPDGTSLMYIERTEEFKKKPPERDWDGSWTMTTK